LGDQKAEKLALVAYGFLMGGIILHSKSILAMVKLGFWFSFLVLTFLFLVPAKHLAPEVFDWYDKLQHSLAFGVLTFLGLLAYGFNQKQASRTAVSIAIYGALIEILQFLSGWRYGEFSDWLADLLGVVIVWGILTNLQKYPQALRFLKKP
jgi:VanZ family protein